MPPSSRKRTSTSYESDDGFIDNDHEPRTKKVKTGKAAPKTKKAPVPQPAEAGEAVAGGGALDSHGDEFWELTSNRRVVVSRFGGKVMVSVREYYEKDGQSLPGKKVCFCGACSTTVFWAVRLAQVWSMDWLMWCGAGDFDAGCAV